MGKIRKKRNSKKEWERYGRMGKGRKNGKG